MNSGPYKKRLQELKDLEKNILEEEYETIKARDDFERLCLALEIGEVGIWTYYPEKDYLIWDETCCKIFGIKFKDWNPEDGYKGFSKYVHVDDILGVSKKVSDAINGNSIYECAYRIYRGFDKKDIINVYAKASNLIHSPKRLLGVVVSLNGLKIDMNMICNNKDCRLRNNVVILGK